MDRSIATEQTEYKSILYISYRKVHLVYIK